MPGANTPLHPKNEKFMSDLYEAAVIGQPGRMEALLSSRSVDVNQCHGDGWTLLRCAARQGHSSVVSVLLSKGADPSRVSETGFSPLHESALSGHLTVTKMLAEHCAAADLDATTKKEGLTPLYVAANRGHWEVMKALIEAGANPDSLTLTGESPLYTAALRGQVDAVKVLLRAKANPLVPKVNEELGVPMLPLDVAAGAGRLGVVREMIQQLGIKGSSGLTRGMNALLLASQQQRTDVVIFLANVGVEDRGSHALMAAAGDACEPVVKTLLQRRTGKSARDEYAYINAQDTSGNTPLIKNILAPRFSSRIVRLLVDAGADTASPCKITSDDGEVCFNGTPLALSNIYVCEKTASKEEGATEKRHRMEAIRRLLLRVDAAHAVSWLWCSNLGSIGERAAEHTEGTKSAWVPLKSRVPVLRRSARRRRALLAALFRYSGKP
ncbi:unnamed protein product [Scytosiphon promiscuus]